MRQTRLEAEQRLQPSLRHADVCLDHASALAWLAGKASPSSHPYRLFQRYQGRRDLFHCHRAQPSSEIEYRQVQTLQIGLQVRSYPDWACPHSLEWTTAN